MDSLLLLSVLVFQERKKQSVLDRTALYEERESIALSHRTRLFYVLFCAAFVSPWLARLDTLDVNVKLIQYA